MGKGECVDGVLARLPNGERVVSTLLTDHAPPRHVYRVVSSSGSVVQDFSTLIELADVVSRTPPSFGLTGVTDLGTSAHPQPTFSPRIHGPTVAR